jgi:Uma2 family endonuclease
MVAQDDLMRRQLTVEEWRLLLATSDIKYEYRDGWVVAMAGGSADHSAVAINITADLRSALGGGPCRVHNSDMAVRYSPTEYRFPDATVSCDARDRGRVKEIVAPRLVVEVLSDSTEKDDRTSKFALARACASVQEYVLIATDYQAVEVYRRAEPRWTYQSYGPGESIDLESLGIALTVKQIYALTEVPLRNDRPRNL